MSMDWAVSQVGEICIFWYTNVDVNVSMIYISKMIQEGGLSAWGWDYILVGWHTTWQMLARSLCFLRPIHVIFRVLYHVPTLEEIVSEHPPIWSDQNLRLRNLLSNTIPYQLIQKKKHPISISIIFFFFHSIKIFFCFLFFVFFLVSLFISLPSPHITTLDDTMI